MKANFDRASSFVRKGLLPYISRTSLEDCHIVLPSDKSEFRRLCERVTELDRELNHIRLCTEVQLTLIDELKTTSLRKLMPLVKEKANGEDWMYSSLT